MKFIYVCILLFSGLHSIAQVNVKAIICNPKKEPLPYTNVASLSTNNNTSSDANGIFQLSNLSIDDTLKFTNIGFITKFVPVKTLSKVDTIFLDNFKLLNEVVIRPHNGYQSEIGYFNHVNNASFMLRPGCELATLIENPGSDGLIQGVFFKLKDKGKCKNSMRVRFLTIDSASLSPGKDVMSEALIINSDQLKLANRIDLTRYNVPFPKGGVFVVLEWVYTDVLCDKNSYSVVSANMSVYEDIVWFNVRDKRWTHGFRPRTPNGNHMTPNVSISVVKFD